MRCVWTKINFLNVLFTGPNFPEFLLPFRKPKRIRTAFSPNQLLKLEQAFEKNQYVVGQERKELAKNLNLSETQVSWTKILKVYLCGPQGVKGRVPSARRVNGLFDFPIGKWIIYRKLTSRNWFTQALVYTITTGLVPFGHSSVTVWARALQNPVP